MDIVIVGGGIVGTSLAYFLGEGDHDVQLLEKEQLGAGATGMSIGCFQWDSNYDGVGHELASRTWELYGPLIEEGELSFQENGTMLVPGDTASLETLTGKVDAARKAGIEARMLDDEEMAAHNVNPAVAAGGAAFYAGAGRLDPNEIVSYLAGSLDDGVEVLTGTEVTDVLTRGGAVTGVRTTDDELVADVVVNGTGVWASRLNALVGVEVPLYHTLAPISVLETDEGFELPTVVLVDSGLYLTGEPHAKQTLAGSAPHASTGSSDERTRFDDPDVKVGRGERVVAAAHRNEVARRAPEVVPKLADADSTNEWQGLRCTTPDELPIVGPTAVDGFYVATGMTGNGITVGPACAERLARVITGDADPGELSPDRF